MRTITQQIRRLTLLFTIMILALAAMPLAGSAQDTTDDQKERCKNGGWQTLADADGTLFSNQGECVKYIATLNSNTREIPGHGSDGKRDSQA